MLFADIGGASLLGTTDWTVVGGCVGAAVVGCALAWWLIHSPFTGWRAKLRCCLGLAGAFMALSAGAMLVLYLGDVRDSPEERAVKDQEHRDFSKYAGNNGIKVLLVNVETNTFNAKIGDCTIEGGTYEAQPGNRFQMKVIRDLDGIPPEISVKGKPPSPGHRYVQEDVFFFDAEDFFREENFPSCRPVSPVAG